MPANDIQEEVQDLRDQGLTDSLIAEELSRKGYPEESISEAMSSIEEIPVPTPGGGLSMPSEMDFSSSMPSSSMPRPSAGSLEGNVYERIEEFAESLIDEKWDELISEVKKIVEWKQKMEEKQVSMLSDLKRLKDDFAILHQGVLGKLDDYDSRMKDVGTELQAVGKVFKEVIPEFVENVKELKHITEKRKR